MRKLIILYGILLYCLTINAQNTLGSADDLGRIALNVYVPDQIEGITPIAKSNLANKLNQIATKNGLGGYAFDQRFVLTANISVISKSITSTAPPMQAFTLEVTLYIGDAIDGKLFSSESVTMKGVGDTETKAYISALKGLNPNDPRFQEMIATGKTRIIEYYNSRCDFIISEAKGLANVHDYDAAIYKLITVPDVCKDCYQKCMDILGPLYQEKIDHDCQMYLLQATNFWTANQDSYGADQAGACLNKIDPMSNCYNDAFNLSERIAKRIYELDKREWKFMLKRWQDVVDIEKLRLKCARDIGVAYGNHQPRNIYNIQLIRGWWR
jgi:hypothetical protein